MRGGGAGQRGVGHEQVVVQGDQGCGWRGLLRQRAQSPADRALVRAEVSSIARGCPAPRDMGAPPGAALSRAPRPLRGHRRSPPGPWSPALEGDPRSARSAAGSSVASTVTPR